MEDRSDLPGQRTHLAGRRPARRGSKDPIKNGSDRRSQLVGLPVLVVDDDAASAKLVAVVLRLEGCDVRTASSAEEALAELSVFHARVIVLDLLLPLMSGLLLTQLIKANPATRDVVVIAVTAMNGPETVRIAREAGCAAYLRKPIDPLALAKLVLNHLEGAP